MKKRLLSIALAVFMLLSLFPATALATGEEPMTLQYDDYVPVAEFGTSVSNAVSVSGDNVLEVTADGHIHAVGIGEATVTVGETTTEVTVEKAKLNVVLVSGQSNANGIHGTLDVNAIAPAKGNGYWWNGSSLEDLSTHVSSINTSVGWYPALAAEWYALTDEKTVIIHKCYPASEISNWATHEGVALDRTTNEIAGENGAIKSCLNGIDTGKYEIVRTGYYWLQGETDAFIETNNENDFYTTAEEYATAYTAMHNAFIQALTISGKPAPYGAILSCRTRNDISNYKAIEYCGMRVAQQYLANTVENLYMASVLTDDWYEAKTISFTADSNEFKTLSYSTGAMGANDIHYNQSGYNVMGLDAADNMYEALCGETKPAVTGIELIGHNGYTKYNEDDTIIAESNARTIGALNQEENGKAQIVARPLPISADPDPSTVTMTLTDSNGSAVNGVMDEYGMIDIAKLKEAVVANGNQPLKLTVSAGGVTKTYKLTSEDYYTPEYEGEGFHYKWDFTLDSSYGEGEDGKVTVSSLFDENTLTYTSTTATHDGDGLDNTASDWFDMASDITLKADEPWTIEWKGSIEETKNSVLLSNNDSDFSATGGRTTPYIYLRNGGDNGVHDASFNYRGAVGSSGAVKFGTEDKCPTFTDTQTWKLSNDGSGILKLTNGTNTWTAANAITEDASFDGLLGRFGSKTTLCYTGTIAYVEIYTPNRENETVPVSIDVTKQPDKIIYEAGENFDPTGMVVTMTDSSGKKEDVTSGCTFSDTELAEGSNNITISYTEGGKTLTTTIEVVVGSSTIVTTGSSYYWDFTQANGGNTLMAVTSEGWDANTLTYTGTMPTVTADGTFTNTSSGYFTTTTPIKLSKDTAWAIEWKGGTTGQSVLLANNIEGENNNSEKKEYVYIHSENGNSVSLRSGGTSGNVRLSNIPSEVKADPDVIWRISYDGKGTVTISCSGTDAANAITPYTGTIDQDYTFNGVLGRFTESLKLCYTGQISYLKVWEEVVPDHLEIDVNDDVELQIGETLSADDITVTAVYNDGSEKAVQATQISSVEYGSDGKPTFTVQAIVDGSVLSGEVEVEVNEEGYHWIFTDSTKVSSNVLNAVSGNNDLTYQGSSLTINERGFTNQSGGYFTMETPVTLPKDAPWTIEWQGNTDGQSVLLANNSDSDTTSPVKAGPYVYIYNDMGAELGNSVSLRKDNTNAAATFSGQSNASRNDDDAIWYLIHDGQGNLKLACKSGGLTNITELKDVIDQNYTFNSVLGYFTDNNKLCYNGTIKYLKIYPTAAEVEGTEGALSVDVNDVETVYNLGEEPDVSGMTVTFKPTDGEGKTITNYTYVTKPALITSDTTSVKVTVSAFGRTAEATFNVKVNTNEPAYFHWAGENSLTSQRDATDNALTDKGSYYTMARPVNLEADNHWRIEWTGSMESGTNGVLLSANTAANMYTTNRITPYIYIRNGGDGGEYDINIIPNGMVGNYAARFELDGEGSGALSEDTTWALDYNDGTLTLSNNKGYAEKKSVQLDTLLFNGIGGYFTVGTTLYYDGTLTDLKIYENLDADYRWDFEDGYKIGDKGLMASAGDVNLTYIGESIPVMSDGLDNTRPNYFNMSGSITLYDDEPWTIEWQGSTASNSVLLANNGEGDTTSPEKSGCYIYIYNDTGRDDGNRIAIRTGGTTSMASFAIPAGLREDDDITWYLVHDGEGNLTLGWKGSDGLYYTTTQSKVVDAYLTFNGALGYFTTNNNLCYTGNIKYIEISGVAKELTNEGGELSVNVDNVKKDYIAGEALDLSGIKVTYTVDGTVHNVTSYTVTADPAMLTAETTSVTLSVTALGKTVTETVTVNVTENAPAYHHWSGSLETLTNANDSTDENALTSKDSGYYSMAEPVYLDADNHWRIKWTGRMEEGDNAILLSNNADYTSRLTPYIYIRNGGDNGEYDISLVYRGHATVSDTSSTLVRFNLVDAYREALSKDSTWALDYEDGKLTLSCDGAVVETKEVVVQDVAFNAIGGYFSSGAYLCYDGTLTDIKVYEALYDMTISNTANGSVTATPGEDVYPGQTVTLTVTPEAGYEVGTVSVTSGGNIEVTENADGTYSFAMPAGQVSVTVSFVESEETEQPEPPEKYAITIEDAYRGDVTADKTTAEAGKTVTITVDPDSGYRLSDLTVTGPDGAEIELKYIGGGKYTFTMPEGAVTIDADFARIPSVNPPEDDDDEPEEPEEPELPFVDVNDGDWFYDAVAYAYENELMDGVSATQFAPNSNLTRGMVVTILYRLEGEPAVTGASGFTDVADVAWYADAVAWAADNGIVNGVTDTEFAPNADITREQFAAILYRYAQYKDYDVSGRADLAEFTDRDSISAYALDAMRWAVDEGIITGMTATTIAPQGTATRAQAATMLMRFIEANK